MQRDSAAIWTNANAATHDNHRTHLLGGSNLPRTEADVPRVSVEGARVALDNGEAIIVDVRSAQAYAIGHIAGAISMPLDRMETDPAAFKLKKDQWIITYCT